MSRITRTGWIAYGLAVAAVALDQVAKTLVVRNLTEGLLHPVLWPLAFRRTWNDGVSFGLLQSTGLIGRWGFVAFSLVGWFLVNAGRQHDAGETRGLDQSLRELATTSRGPILLLVLAIGMVLFGAFRVCDAVLRRRSEITQA